MKTCKKCIKYNKDLNYCKFYEINVLDRLSATHCSKYKDKNKKRNKVKCISCANINKYNYCYFKRKCFDYEEITKDRQCVYFKPKGSCYK